MIGTGGVGDGEPPEDSEALSLKRKKVSNKNGKKNNGRKKIYYLIDKKY